VTFRQTNSSHPGWRIRFAKADDRWKACIQIWWRWQGRCYWTLWFLPP
jgi:hypothetical protein